MPKSCILLSAILVVLLLGACTLEDQIFTIVVFPDTQYVAVSTKPDRWMAMNRWVLSHRTEFDIKTLLTTGDIIDNTKTANFELAVAGFKLLEDAGIPVVPILGNHNYDNLTTRTVTSFDQFFGPDHFRGKSWYQGNLGGSNANYYIVQNIEGQRFLFLALEFLPSAASIVWANQVLADHPDAEAIILTHAYQEVTGQRMKQGSVAGPQFYGMADAASGEELWDQLVKKWPNVLATIAGHINRNGGPNTACLDSIGDHGNTVHQFFINYQDTIQTWAGLLHFDLAKNTVV
jgi:hypothetical protein